MDKRYELKMCVHCDVNVFADPLECKGRDPRRILMFAIRIGLANDAALKKRKIGC